MSSPSFLLARCGSAPRTRYVWDSILRGRPHVLRTRLRNLTAEHTETSPEWCAATVRNDLGTYLHWDYGGECPNGTLPALRVACAHAVWASSRPDLAGASRQPRLARPASPSSARPRRRSRRIRARRASRLAAAPAHVRPTRASHRPTCRVVREFRFPPTRHQLARLVCMRAGSLPGARSSSVANY